MNNERGNVFVYVLIAVVLFAALTFILAKQEDEKEITTLSPERAKLLATQLITTATQVKSALDQMVFAGTDPSEFDFAQPGSFGAAPHFDKVFHPQGGGVTLPPFPEEVTGQSTADPGNGWYLGRFNNFEWTVTAANDVVLTAYGINQQVCQELNRILVGNTTIPAFTDETRKFLVDDAGHGYTNADLTIAVCAGCESQASLCVQNNLNDTYSFYNLVAAR
mgnify:CR=1 FL=1